MGSFDHLRIATLAASEPDIMPIGMETWKSGVGVVKAVGSAPEVGLKAKVDILAVISSEGAFLAKLELEGTDLGDIEAS